MSFWDTAGQERFAPVVSMYYRQCRAVVLVYDVSSADSAQKLKGLFEAVTAQCDYDARDQLKGIVVGNKTDLEEDPAACDTVSFLGCSQAAHRLRSSMA
eukprot:m.36454 g.36454  ORF g.36454 m.36454 type:complete len:99 (-) comp12474_c0_seq4:975-1271(-)